jgi:hypothetical protein
MSDNLQEVEVKALFLQSDGSKQFRWTKKSVSDAVDRPSNQVRCPECHGALRLRPIGPRAEHRSKSDSEHCPSGQHYKGVFTLSENPVE